MKLHLHFSILAFWILLLSGYITCPTTKIKIYDPETSPRYAELSRDADITCIVWDREGKTVKWLHDKGGHMFHLSEGLITSDMRHSVDRPSARSRLWRLKIKGVSMKDEGTYRCRVYLSDTVYVEATTELQVVKTPEFSTQRSSPSFMKIEASEPLDLTCSADAIPKATVTWSRMGGAVLPNGGITRIGEVLSIPSVSPEDRGDYVCTARNIHGAATRHLKLGVMFNPVLSAEKLVYKQATGNDKELLCYVESSPGVSRKHLQWLRDGYPISEDEDKYVMTFMKGAMQRVTWKLYIKNVKSSDYGKYTCDAQPVLSSGVGTTKLDLQLLESNRKTYDVGQVLSSAMKPYPFVAFSLVLCSLVSFCT